MARPFFKNRDKAILFGALILAVAFFLMPEKIQNTTKALPEEGAVSKPVPTEHWIGNPKAPVVIIQYSDTDCVYCAVFHTAVVKQLIATYGRQGELAWVYRHFPIANVNPNGAREALALECVADTSNDPSKFWSMLDAIFEAKPLSPQTDPVNFIKTIAGLYGLSEAQLSKCENNNEFRTIIRNQSDEAISAGAEGAPFMVVYANGEFTETISGTRSLEQMQKIIDGYLK
ncbi:MAG: thioredoxin domain-containing protein [Candidatus Paceibacterota bacterium]